MSTGFRIIAAIPILIVLGTVAGGTWPWSYENGQGTVVSHESPEHGNFSPESLGGATAPDAAVVDDPDSMVARPIAAGAREIHPVVEEHG